MKFKCDIYFLTRKEGGRQTDPNSGLLSQFIFWEKYSTCCEITHKSVKSFALGETYSGVYISLPFWQENYKFFGEKIKLNSDETYFLAEGNKKIAKVWNIHEITA